MQTRDYEQIFFDFIQQLQLLDRQAFFRDKSVDADAQSSRGIAEIKQASSIEGLVAVIQALAVPPSQAMIHFMMKKLGELQYLDLASSCYNLLISKNLVNKFTCTIMIDIAGKFQAIDLAEQAYRKALKMRNLDCITHATMFVFAKRNNRMDLAVEAYQHAVQSGVANTSLHNDMIIAAGRSRDMSLVYQAYQNAVQSGSANIVTCNKALEVAEYNFAFDFATEVYQYSLKREIANHATHLRMIDCLVRNEKLEKAREICKKNKIGFPVKEFENNIYEIDLQGASHGLAYLAIYYFLEEAKEGEGLNVLCAQGLPSSCIKDNRLALIKAVKSAIEAHQSSREMSWVMTRDNPDRLFIVTGYSRQQAIYTNSSRSVFFGLGQATNGKRALQVEDEKPAKRFKMV